jgi:hypothetical protein
VPAHPFCTGTRVWRIPDRGQHGWGGSCAELLELAHQTSGRLPVAGVVCQSPGSGFFRACDGRKPHRGEDCGFLGVSSRRYVPPLRRQRQPLARARPATPGHRRLWRNAKRHTPHCRGWGRTASSLETGWRLGISDRVVFHGFTTGKALDALFDRCHIAVGSLGIHRKGLTQTSELNGILCPRCLHIISPPQNR